ncbi:hypothetical protein EDB89DRAFT_1902858 [Lactarius sanguifluus]|nr:hypothetical protein EDB89DRAFT_1902858 [Lactarius sanguifluus]
MYSGTLSGNNWHTSTDDKGMDKTVRDQALYNLRKGEDCIQAQAHLDSHSSLTQVQAHLGSSGPFKAGHMPGSHDGQYRKPIPKAPGSFVADEGHMHSPSMPLARVAAVRSSTAIYQHKHPHLHLHPHETHRQRMCACVACYGLYKVVTPCTTPTSWQVDQLTGHVKSSTISSQSDSDDQQAAQVQKVIQVQVLCAAGQGGGGGGVAWWYGDVEVAIVGLGHVEVTLHAMLGSGSMVSGSESRLWRGSGGVLSAGDDTTVGWRGGARGDGGLVRWGGGGVRVAGPESRHVLQQFNSSRLVQRGDGGIGVMSSGWGRKKKKDSTGTTRREGAPCICWRGGGSLR